MQHNGLAQLSHNMYQHRTPLFHQGILHLKRGETQVILSINIPFMVLEVKE